MLWHVHPFWEVPRRVLFGAACVRRVWEFVSHPRLRAFVEVAEGWATGRGPEIEFTGESRWVAANRPNTSSPHFWVRRAESAVWYLAQLSITKVTEYTADALANHTVEHAFELVPLENQIAELDGNLDRRLEKREAAEREGATGESRGRRMAERRLRRAGCELRDLKQERQLARGRIAVAALRTEHAAQADLLRCGVGNPFASAVFARRWRSETVAQLLRGIVAERAYDRLPILADALEESGCDHPDVLAHCRTPGPHALGCWVIEGLVS